MAKKALGSGNWVTINGTHVFIQGGKITKGPSKFIGSTVADMEKTTSTSNSSTSNDTKTASAKTIGTANNKSSNLILTKKAESHGWTEKDVKSLNSIADDFSNVSVSWSRANNLKAQVSVTVSGKERPVAYVHPVRTLSGKDGYFLTGKGRLPEAEYVTLGRVSSTIKKEISKINNANGITPTFNPTGAKYPSGITTTAQKRAYTRALNSGMSSSEAKQSALKKN